MEPIGFGEDQTDHAAPTAREERIGTDRKGLSANQNSRVPPVIILMSAPRLAWAVWRKARFRGATWVCHALISTLFCHELFEQALHRLEGVVDHFAQWLVHFVCGRLFIGHQLVTGGHGDVDPY